MLAALASTALAASVTVGATPGSAAAATPPVAVNDAYTTTSSAPLNQVAAGGVLTNDTDDGPAASLTASNASTPAHGTVNLNGDGSFNYSAVPNYVGTDTFTYTVSDGVDGSSTGLVTITVNPDVAKLLKDINPGSGASNPLRFSQSAGTVFFLGTDPAVKGLYKTDGTTSGTVQLKSIDVGVLADIPTPLPPTPVAGGKVVFSANDGTTGKELWVSDGTAIGTVLLKDINPGATGSAPTQFVAVGGSAFFIANDGTNGVELWKTDGTAPGTVLVKDINAGSGSGSPAGLVAFGSSVVFSGTTAAEGAEPWISDGTTGGTVMIKDVLSGATGSSPAGFLVRGSTVWFSANDGTTGAELWTTDGTSANTTQFKDINPGSASGNPAQLTLFGSNVLFAATTAATGAELWKSDGTPTGTALLKEIRPTATGSSISLMTAVSPSYVMFLANDGTNGIEYWRSDGTTTGTTLLKNINPGSSSQNITVLTYSSFGGRTYFSASDGSGVGGHGTELWRTDGTTAGTALAQEINPFGNAFPTSPANLLGTVLFSATDGTKGQELWRFAPPNTAPVAANDSYSTNEDTQLTVAAPGVLGNDSDADANVLHDATKLSDPANGSVSFNGNGSFTYTPNANYNGSDSFTYKVTDGMDDSNTATVTITVNAVNDAPVAVDDTATMAENTVLTVAAPGVLANDSDADGDTLTAGSASMPANGSLTLNADGSYAYTPNAGFDGSDSFTYKANDGTVDSNAATVSITVTGSNDAPVCSNVSLTTSEDTPGVTDPNCTDPEGDPVTYAIVVGATNGSASVGMDDKLHYSPDADFNGSDSFTYKANDGVLDSTTATVSVTVTGTNDAPVCTGVSLTAAEDTAGVTDPSCTDIDGDTLSYAIVGAASNGSASVGMDNKLHYSPAANFNGSDSFTYKANDGSADSNTATVAVTVSAVNDAPMATGDSYSTPANTPKTVAAPGVLANDTDVEADPLSAGSATSVVGGSVTLNADGSFTYTPNFGFSGAGGFYYTASDGNGGTATATVTITVAGAGTSYLAVNDVTVTEGNTGTVPATFTITRSGDISGTSKLSYATVAATATSPSDYAALALTTVTFGPGETTKSVTVAVNGDTANETNETFSLKLSSPLGAVISDPKGVATIVNDDPVPGPTTYLAVNDVSIVEGAASTSAFATFTITRSGVTTASSTVTYATANGTATSGSDYKAKAATAVTFAAGETTKTVSVKVFGDSTVEPDESFKLKLSSPTGATISDGTGIATIVNDD